MLQIQISGDFDKNESKSLEIWEAIHILREILVDSPEIMTNLPMRIRKSPEFQNGSVVTLAATNSQPKDPTRSTHEITNQVSPIYKPGIV